MRTVTFADAKVVDCLRDRFILVWHNQSPDLYAETGNQDKPSAAQAAAYPEGGGGGNVRSYFCSPNGTVATYLEGFWQPASYLREAKAAADICQRIDKAADVDAVTLIADHLASRRREMASRRSTARKEIQARHTAGLAGDMDVVRADAPYGLLDRSLAASEALSKKPIELILSELAERNRFHGAIV